MPENQEFPTPSIQRTATFAGSRESMEFNSIKNFIIKLPLSKELIIKTEFNSILIIVDELTKWRMFIPYKKLFTAENLVYTFLR